MLKTEILRMMLKVRYSYFFHVHFSPATILSYRSWQRKNTGYNEKIFIHVSDAVDETHDKFNVIASEEETNKDHTAKANLLRYILW